MAGRLLHQSDRAQFQLAMGSSGLLCSLPAAGAAGNYSSFGVNPLDSSVPAGTPVNYEANSIFGDTGAGYTGLYANSVGVVPTIAPMNVAPSSYDFGTVSGTTATTAVSVLTNNDSVSYNISGIAITPAHILTTSL